MSFEDQITRLPRPFDPEMGRDARASAPWASGDVARLIEGAGGCSPYLKSLIGRESEWLETALDAPEGALDNLFADLSGTPAVDLASSLRQAKRRVALLVALCDLSGVWLLETVTGTLTRFADLACQLALRDAIATEVRRGKLPGVLPEDTETAGGMVVLAMGKMGAGELNYSSDIDLICLFDETRFDPGDYHDARAGFVRATRRMSSTLNDLTGEGYVFRTDLRLRPDPAVTPVCIAMEAAERYYESLGRTWERAAFIKARPCAGDTEAGARFLATLRPFVWRKHLDFAAIKDAHDMVLRIREHKGLSGAISLAGHDMKLGRGGIREIEFFTQTRQLIAGGRDPDLRLRGTVAGLDMLAKKGWIPEDTARTLVAHYRAHRETEHRVQMINDAQTHALPRSDEGFERLAALSGQEVAAFKTGVLERLEEVHGLITGFFEPEPGAAPPADSLPEVNAEIVGRWHTYPALRSQRGMDIFTRLRPEFLRRLNATGHPEEALLAFDGFLKGLPAGVQLFSLFEANPHLIDLLVDIVGVSPDLARYLSRNAGVFDAVIGGDFFAPWPGHDALRDDLAARLADERDYEGRLDAARRWVKEWHFRVGVHLLRGLIDAAEAGRQYADLADATLADLLPVVEAEFATKHGPWPGRGAVVLGMGSLGSCRLHALSDLDLIVVYDPQDDEFSEGRRPLATRPYYARLTQALITALTAPMAEGKLYEADMRLRPSGNQGPVATSLTAFRDYQQNKAWTWEHLALTRARVVAGPKDLASDVEAFRRDLLSQPRDGDKVLRDVAEMRQRIAAAKGGGDVWDPKLGRGRMQDIELVAQAGSLLSRKALRGIHEGLRAASDCGWLSSAAARHLRETYDLCWSVQVAARLISDGAFDPEASGAAAAAFVCRVAGADTVSSLKDRLVRATLTAADFIDAALPDVA